MLWNWKQTARTLIALQMAWYARSNHVLSCIAGFHVLVNRKLSVWSTSVLQSMFIWNLFILSEKVKCTQHYTFNCYICIIYCLIIFRGVYRTQSPVNGKKRHCALTASCKVNVHVVKNLLRVRHTCVIPIIKYGAQTALASFST